MKLFLNLISHSTVWLLLLGDMRAATGDLDLSFGGTGKVITPIGGSAESRGVVLQQDGKVVVAGYASSNDNKDFAVVRYNSNGTLDTSFGGTGKVVTDISDSDYGECIALQSDGKIVIAGSWRNGNVSDIALVRYDANGILDTAFNGTGKVTTAVGFRSGANSVAIQGDGKIVVAGGADVLGGPSSEYRLAVLRYIANGSLDTSFNGTGKVTTAVGSREDSASSVVVQTDGKIVVGGLAYDSGGIAKNALVRYNTDGSLDTTFGGTGKVTTDTMIGRSIAVQGDGRIVVVGEVWNGSNSDFAVVRYNTDGNLDTTFGSAGMVTTDFSGSRETARGVAMQIDGKIVVAGETDHASGNSDFAIVRYDSNGILDTTFGGNGKVTTDFDGNRFDMCSDVAVQQNGNIVVAGWSGYPNVKIALARYENGTTDTDGDGIADRYETGTGIFVSAEATGTSPTVADSDGDGLNDGTEVYVHHSDPNVRDTDGDGFNDGFEVNSGFNPTLANSAPDALSSIRTAIDYRFGAANGISYRIEASTDLVNWSTIETNIIGAGSEISRLYSIEGQTKRYFRSRRN